MEYFDSFMLYLLFEEGITSKVRQTHVSPKMNMKETVSIIFGLNLPLGFRRLFWYAVIPIFVPVLTYSVYLCLSSGAGRHAAIRRQVEEAVRDDRFLYKFPIFLLLSEPGGLLAEQVIESLNKNFQQIFQPANDVPIVCTEDLEFHPGKSRLKETERCFTMSATVLVIVTADFLKDSYCKKQLEIACMMNKPIVLLLMEDVDKNRLPWRVLSILSMEVKYDNNTKVIAVPKFDELCCLLLEKMTYTLIS